jgi:hypothetical protein
MSQSDRQGQRSEQDQRFNPQHCFLNTNKSCRYLGTPCDSFIMRNIRRAFRRPLFRLWALETSSARKKRRQRFYAHLDNLAKAMTSGSAR